VPTEPIHPGRQDASTNNGRKTALNVPSTSDAENNGARCKFQPPGHRDGPSGTPPHTTRRLRVLLALSLLFGCVGLFVGADVIERHVFPEMPTAWRHGLLALRATMVTGIGLLIVYAVMKRHQERIGAAAELLARRLEAFRSNSTSAARFENPHRVHCREVLDCQRTECPMFNATEPPCWQVVALSKMARDGRPPNRTVQQCHVCKVYRVSCPDGLTKLGESFNSLLFMLEEEAEQVRRMHAQMVEKEKIVAMGQLAAGIAHEIGNPLSSISSIVQMLKRRPSSDTNPQQLDLIQKHIQRISTTVRQLAGLAHPATERWEWVDPTTTLEEAVNLVAFDRRARRVKIAREVPAALPNTYVLRGQLQQVFINLLLNAFDAMEGGGLLKVRAKTRSRSIAFEFEDTGCGIPPEIGRRIFEPFFTTKEQGRGTGMGLAVSYGIVQKHGGTLDFMPRPGGGTVFRVEIPVTDRLPEQ